MFFFSELTIIFFIEETLGILEKKLYASNCYKIIATRKEKKLLRRDRQGGIGTLKTSVF